MDTDNREGKSETGTGKIPLKRLVIWCILNGTMATILIFGIFYGLAWCFNIVKFTVWANFIIWFFILIGGEKSWKANRAKGFTVGPWVNVAYGILFCGVLASAGHFGYAGMELVTMILQNTIHFSDAIIDR